MSSKEMVPAKVLSLPSPTEFSSYTRAVNNFPILSDEEEKVLVEAWNLNEDKEAAMMLVASHLRMVVKVVKEHRGYGLPDEDLAQEGTVGLMKAVQKFDHSVGVRLAAYALKWIEAEVREYIFRNWRLVRMSGSSQMKKLFFGYRRVVGDLKEMSADREMGVSREDIAEAMGVTVEQVIAAESYFIGKDSSLIMNSEEEFGNEEVLMLEAVERSTNMTPALIVEEEDYSSKMKKELMKAIDSLPERERKVVIGRKLTVPPLGLSELGEILGVTAERVRQIEKKALVGIETFIRNNVNKSDVLLLEGKS